MIPRTPAAFLIVLAAAPLAAQTLQFPDGREDAVRLRLAWSAKEGGTMDLSITTLEDRMRFDYEIGGHKGTLYTAFAKADGIPGLQAGAPLFWLRAQDREALRKAALAVAKEAQGESLTEAQRTFLRNYLLPVLPLEDPVSETKAVAPEWTPREGRRRTWLDADNRAFYEETHLEGDLGITFTCPVDLPTEASYEVRMGDWRFLVRKDLEANGAFKTVGRLSGPKGLGLALTLTGEWSQALGQEMGGLGSVHLRDRDFRARLLKAQALLARIPERDPDAPAVPRPQLVRLLLRQIRTDLGGLAVKPADPETEVEVPYIKVAMGVRGLGFDFVVPKKETTHVLYTLELGPLRFMVTRSRKDGDYDSQRRIFLQGNNTPVTLVSWTGPWDGTEALDPDERALVTAHGKAVQAGIDRIRLLLDGAARKPDPGAPLAAPTLAALGRDLEAIAGVFRKTPEPAVRVLVDPGNSEVRVASQRGGKLTVHPAGYELATPRLHVRFRRGARGTLFRAATPDGAREYVRSHPAERSAEGKAVVHMALGWKAARTSRAWGWLGYRIDGPLVAALKAGLDEAQGTLGRRARSARNLDAMARWTSRDLDAALADLPPALAEEKDREEKDRVKGASAACLAFSVGKSALTVTSEGFSLRSPALRGDYQRTAADTRFVLAGERGTHSYHSEGPAGREWRMEVDRLYGAVSRDWIRRGIDREGVAGLKARLDAEIAAWDRLGAKGGTLDAAARHASRELGDLLALADA